MPICYELLFYNVNKDFGIHVAADEIEARAGAFGHKAAQISAQSESLLALQNCSAPPAFLVSHLYVTPEFPAVVKCTEKQDVLTDVAAPSATGA